MHLKQRLATRELRARDKQLAMQQAQLQAAAAQLSPGKPLEEALAALQQLPSPPPGVFGEVCCQNPDCDTEGGHRYTPTSTEQRFCPRCVDSGELGHYQSSSDDESDESSDESDDDQPAPGEPAPEPEPEPELEQEDPLRDATSMHTNTHSSPRSTAHRTRLAVLRSTGEPSPRPKYGGERSVMPTVAIYRHKAGRGPCHTRAALESAGCPGIQQSIASVCPTRDPRCRTRGSAGRRWAPSARARPQLSWRPGRRRDPVPSPPQAADTPRDRATAPGRAPAEACAPLPDRRDTGGPRAWPERCTKARRSRASHGLARRLAARARWSGSPGPALSGN
eukprot:COSAG02_NODE_8425_length_2575_cov_4.168821_5_plen_336_part_00